MGMVHLGFTFSNVTSVGVIVLPYIANFLKSLFDYTGKFLFYQAKQILKQHALRSTVGQFFSSLYHFTTK